MPGAASRFEALVINGKMAGGWNAPEIYRWLGENFPGLEKHVLFTFSTLPEPEIRAFLHEHNIAVPGKTLRGGGPDLAG